MPITKQSMDAASAALRKSAQSLLDRLKEGADEVMPTAHHAMDDFAVKVKDNWDRLPPEIKKTLYGMLAGAGVGGAAGVMSGVSSHGDDSALGSALTRGAAGAAMGGAAGGLGMGGYQLMSQGRMLPGEERGFSPLRSGTDMAAGAVMAHPGVAAGLLAGGIYGYRNTPSFSDLDATLSKRVADTAENTPARTRAEALQKTFNDMLDPASPHAVDKRKTINSLLADIRAAHPPTGKVLDSIHGAIPGGIGDALYENRRMYPSGPLWAASNMVGRELGNVKGTGDWRKVVGGLTVAPALGLIGERYIKGDE